MCVCISCVGMCMRKPFISANFTIFFFTLVFFFFFLYPGARKTLSLLLRYCRVAYPRNLRPPLNFEALSYCRGSAYLNTSWNKNCLTSS